MELLGLKFDLLKLFKKGKIVNDVDLVDRTKNRNILQLFEHFYHVEKSHDLALALKDDFIASFFMRSGSGLLSSFARGLYFKLFIDFKPPAVIGKSFRIINKSKVKIGRVFWAKDNVTLFAGGPLVIGDSCVLAERSTIWSGKGGVYIGNNFFLGIGSYISAIGGKVKIGRDVMIADDVSLYTWNHKYGKGEKSFSEMGGVVEDITIGNNCWIGSGTKILAGVRLGDNCVVAAGTILKGKFHKNSVIAGVPAKIIKKIK